MDDLALNIANFLQCCSGLDLATVPELNRVLFTKPIGQETNVEPDLMNLAGIPGLEVISIYQGQGEIMKKNMESCNETDGL